ncbi:Uma2 family endonuclease [Thiotrichales bacterium HSG1]|nr:Uma2 family endonuclease [Thiotrichales bacterium HSG1]
MLPYYNNAYAKAKLIGALLKLEKYSVFTDLTLNLDNKNYTPDISLYPKRDVNLSLPEPIEMIEMPAVAIEVLSHTQTLEEILDQFTVYFGAVVKSCWLVVPIGGAIVVYTSPEEAVHFTSGDVIDEQMNIHLPIDDIFSTEA